MRAYIIPALIYITTCSSLFGQFKTVPLRLYETKQTAADTTLTLPFWEDFSTSGTTPDTLRWSYGYDVFVNDGLGQNPPTYKVATLDGLRGDGTAYSIDNEVLGVTDSLISQKINLAGLGAGDNVYISFFWQAGGYGELPDEEDSLSLSLYTIDGQWESVWRTTGGFMGEDFIQEILPIEAARYMHANFKFKFQAHGNLAGPFDTWHIDYIYINHSRSIADTVYYDRSITTKPSPLFNNYYEIPSSIFLSLDSNSLGTQTLMVKNLLDIPSPLSFYYKLTNLTTKEIYYEANIPDPDIVPASLAPLENLTIPSPPDVIIPNSIIAADSMIIESSFYLLTEDTTYIDSVSLGAIDFKQNDTVKAQYLINKHYAYDDGTAEYAAGINVPNGEIAVKYGLARPDTLSHIDICFPSINPSSVGETINIKVWSKIGTEETLLAAQLYTITQDIVRNSFQRIRLSQARIVQDTIYIGFQQLREEYIGVGIDRNNPEAMGNIYTKTNSATWQQNDRLQGIFMIRPVFDADSTFVLANEPEITRDISLYPNPTSGDFSIDSDHDKIEVYNLSGSLVYKSTRKETYQLRSKPGLYIVRIFSRDGLESKKLIIR